MAKQKKFDIVKAVKDASRANIGPLPRTKIVPNKKLYKRKPKFGGIEDEKS